MNDEEKRIYGNRCDMIRDIREISRKLSYMLVAISEEPKDTYKGILEKEVYGVIDQIITFSIQMKCELYSLNGDR